MGNPKIDINTKIVCLGGGIGTSHLIHGLKRYFTRITVITSMADDGGSSGRLRKAFNILPPGDIISCMAALIPDENKELASILTHRFPGIVRDKKSLAGHKLGNLMMLAEIQRTGDFYKALDSVKKMCGVTADILPATDERTHLSAITLDGRRIFTETTLDLALYAQPHGLKKIFIRPKNPIVNSQVISALEKADIIISGPGDLYTNQLPVLIIPSIHKTLIQSKAKKLFIINIANKPFETKGFSVSDYVLTIIQHLQTSPFNMVFANNNFSYAIPKKYPYKYVEIDKEIQTNNKYKLVLGDFVNKDFPLYHDSLKLAKNIREHI